MAAAAAVADKLHHRRCTISAFFVEDVERCQANHRGRLDCHLRCLKWVSLLPVLQEPQTRCLPPTMTIQQPPIPVGPCFDGFALKIASLGASVNSFYSPQLLAVTPLITVPNLFGVHPT